MVGVPSISRGLAKSASPDIGIVLGEGIVFIEPQASSFGASCTAGSADELSRIILQQHHREREGGREERECVSAR